jgi:hypothetical protein
VQILAHSKITGKEIAETRQGLESRNSHNRRGRILAREGNGKVEVIYDML